MNKNGNPDQHLNSFSEKEHKFSNIPVRSFAAFLELMPAERISTGYLDLGEWRGDEYEQEIEVELHLAPDGQVWAEVGPLAGIPLLPHEEREEQAQRILADFLAAYTRWANQQPTLLPTPKSLRSWPAWQLTIWLYEAAQDTPGEMGRLMTDVLVEIQAMGFRVEPDPWVSE